MGQRAPSAPAPTPLGRLTEEHPRASLRPAMRSSERPAATRRRLDWCSAGWGRERDGFGAGTEGIGLGSGSRAWAGLAAAQIRNEPRFRAGVGMGRGLARAGRKPRQRLPRFGGR
jgi:hypothetical protein